MHDSFPRIASLSTLLFVLVFTGAVQASIITPGPGASPPDIFAFTCPGASCPTLLASTTSTWTNLTNTMSGTYEAAVYSDPTNTFGAGLLDFVYQFSNDAGSTDSVGRVTAINFTGWSTDVGYTGTGSVLGSSFVDGTVAPELVDRVSPGDSVGFSFNAPLTTFVAPGQTSTLLIIETNASNYAPGYVSLIDGGPTTLAAYEPTAPSTVPEPNFLLLLCIGLLALVGSRQFARTR